MTDISIIIASYEVRDLLLDCLASIRDSRGVGAVETIVVDNGSRDGSVEAVREAFPEVRVIANAENLGYAAANNRALAECGGRYVLLLNPDTVLRERTLAEVSAVMDSRPDVGLCGIKLVREDGSLDRACRRNFPTPLSALSRFTRLDKVFPKSKVFGHYNLDWRDPDGEYEVEAIVGAFMFCRRELLEEVGVLDEQFFMYGEDLDWCWRIQRSDWKVLYLGSQEILHVKGASSSRNPRAANRHFHQAMLIFHKKHLDQRYPFFVNWAVSLGIASRWAFKSLLLRMRGRGPSERRA